MKCIHIDLFVARFKWVLKNNMYCERIESEDYPSNLKLVEEYERE